MIEYDDEGNKRHYRDGVLHRVDGPAIEFERGSGVYYINGVKLTPREFLKVVKK